MLSAYRMSRAAPRREGGCARARDGLLRVGREATRKREASEEGTTLGRYIGLTPTEDGNLPWQEQGQPL